MLKSSSVRKNVVFPADLLARMVEFTRGEGRNFSEFVRKSIEERIERIEKERLCAALEEGYRAKSELNLKISKDFEHVDGENI